MRRKDFIFQTVEDGLELLDLTGAVVTLDAMHCQKETAQAICDKCADYVLTVKSRIRLGDAPEIAGFLQRLALSILKRDTSVKKCSIRGKRLQAGWCNDVLEGILTGKQGD